MTLRQSHETVRSSRGTQLMTRVLRFGIGRRLGTSLVVMRLRGRNSGTLFELVVQYATVPMGIVVVPAKPESKQWWRNLRTRQPIDVLRDGAWHHARGIVLYESDAEYSDALAAYLERWPRVRVPRGQPLVLVTWLDERDQAAAAS